MELSLVIPAYNEEQNLSRHTIDRVINYFKSKKMDYEIIVVDDGSTDKTAVTIEKAYGHESNFRLIKKKHEGKAFSVIAGIQAAKYKYVAFSDFDLATPIEEMEKLFPYIKDYEMVIGSRKTNRQGAPLIRKIMAKGFIIIRDLMVNLKGIRDTQCGFKLFQTAAALKTIENLKVFKVHRETEGPSVTAGFDLEFLYTAKKLGYKIKEVPVIWYHVETKRVNFVKDTIETLVDMFRIRFG